MGGGAARGPAQPRELVSEVETHLRALLRDVVCGYLDTDLKGVADEILLEDEADPAMEIKARDLRREEPPEPEMVPEPELGPESELVQEPEPEPEPDTSEMEPVDVQSPLEGVTASSEWSDDPEDYSAPV
jgi:hypothetical protein